MTKGYDVKYGANTPLKVGHGIMVKNYKNLNRVCIYNLALTHTLIDDDMCVAIFKVTKIK